MKAIYYTEFGNADVVEFGERPAPTPGPREVVIKVAAAGVNPVDWKVREGWFAPYFETVFPVIPGWDVSGRISAIGDSVAGWNVGDAVMSYCRSQTIHAGCYAEYVAVDASTLARKPDRASFAEAASLPLCALTAWQAFTEFRPISSGDSVLIHAGAGGLGSIAIPLAKHLGGRVLTTAQHKNAEYLLERGADTVIDYTTQDYRDVVRSLAPGGVEMVFEAIGGDASAEAVSLTRDGGAIVLLNNFPPDDPEIVARSIKADWLHGNPDGAALAHLADLFDEGVFSAPELHLLPLSDAATAHRRSESLRVRGKIVLEVARL